MFGAIGEYIKKYFEEHSEQMWETSKDLILENLPQIVELAGKTAKEIAKNAKYFLK